MADGENSITACTMTANSIQAPSAPKESPPVTQIKYRVL